jgi:hypothetical protein
MLQKQKGVAAQQEKKLLIKLHGQLLKKDIKKILRVIG